jgi:hypothetical protein
MQADPEANAEDVDEYLSQLAALAGSSLAGALQSTYGAVR